MTVQAPVETEPKSTKGWRPRAWMVMVLALVVLVGGGIGAIAASNLIAHLGYANRMTAPETLAELTIPRFGDRYAVPVVVGTSWSSLRKGVGWYEGSAWPGQYGNCAIAGHRLGWGEPFAGLDTLEVGDEIRLRVDEVTYIYTVITAATAVSSAQTDVLAPVPGNPDRLPTKALLTLTTAASDLPTPNRLVVVAELARG
ncbi:MAG: class E sortase [Propionibacteriaceae bacterium]|jgi:sortase A|nr:class E sortase [Propionibacteriaceae bacterium]